MLYGLKPTASGSIQLILLVESLPLPLLQGALILFYN